MLKINVWTGQLLLADRSRSSTGQKNMLHLCMYFYQMCFMYCLLSCCTDLISLEDPLHVFVNSLWTNSCELKSMIETTNKSVHTV